MRVISHCGAAGARATGRRKPTDPTAQADVNAKRRCSMARGTPAEVEPLGEGQNKMTGDRAINVRTEQ